jgi:hypothetical protein
VARLIVGLLVLRVMLGRSNLCVFRPHLVRCLVAAVIWCRELRSASRFLDGGRCRWRSAGGVRWVTLPMVALGAESGGDGRRRKIKGRESCM